MAQELDKEQNRRIGDMEKRLNQVESDMAALLARIDTLILVMKGLGAMAGLAFGIDFIPYMQGGL